MSLSRFYQSGLASSATKYIAASNQFFHVSGLNNARAESKRGLPKGFRPPTAFSLLAKEISKPGMKIADVGRAASNEWKNLSPEQVQAYKDKAAKIGLDRKKQFLKLSEEEKSFLYVKQDTQRKIRKLKNQLLETQAASF